MTVPSRMEKKKIKREKFGINNISDMLRRIYIHSPTSVKSIHSFNEPI